MQWIMEITQKLYIRTSVKHLTEQTLFKLQKMGIEPGLLNWINSYLTNRVQNVRFLNIISRPVQVTSGVPQGSHLGPLLFILYVNDISFLLKRLNVLIYADDMKLYIEIRNANDLIVFQNEINTFYTWCSKSLLQLNVKNVIQQYLVEKIIHQAPIYFQAIKQSKNVKL